MPRPRTSLRIPEIILSTSSSLNRSGISPAPNGMRRITARPHNLNFRYDFLMLEMLYHTKSSLNIKQDFEIRNAVFLCLH